ncbi:MAG: hypothetical protein ACJ736_28940, partial [Streptomyces sp.]
MIHVDGLRLDCRGFRVVGLGRGRRMVRVVGGGLGYGGLRGVERWRGHRVIHVDGLRLDCRGFRVVGLG